MKLGGAKSFALEKDCESLGVRWRTNVLVEDIDCEQSLFFSKIRVKESKEERNKASDWSERASVQNRATRISHLSCFLRCVPPKRFPCKGEKVYLGHKDQQRLATLVESSRTILSMGRSRTADLVFSVTPLTSPSFLFGFTTRKRLRNEKFSTTSTMCPCSK